jgi:hypothetical protein
MYKNGDWLMSDDIEVFEHYMVADGLDGYRLTPNGL